MDCNASPARIPDELRAPIDEGKFIVVYGPYGTGKTHLAYEAARYLLSEKASVVVLATEVGTATYARSVATCVPTKVVLTSDELVRYVVKLAAEGSYIIVDSINWLFRSEPDSLGGKELSFIASVMRQVGGLATGQVTDVDSGNFEMAMGRWVLPWADVIARTERITCKRGPCSTLTFIKPYTRTLIFGIRREGVEWIG